MSEKFLVMEQVELARAVCHVTGTKEIAVVPSGVLCDRGGVLGLHLTPNARMDKV
jgi:hypothetical protein